MNQVRKKTKHELVIEKAVELLREMPYEVKEIASYETNVLDEIYDYAKLSIRKKYCIESRAKAVIAHLNEECRKRDSKLRRSWNKSISGIDTFFFLP